MTNIAHLTALKRKHAVLEGQLHEAKAHPSLPEKAIMDLKRKKLALKDEITKLSATQ